MVDSELNLHMKVNGVAQGMVCLVCSDGHSLVPQRPFVFTYGCFCRRWVQGVVYPRHRVIWRRCCEVHACWQHPRQAWAYQSRWAARLVEVRPLIHASYQAMQNSGACTMGYQAVQQKEHEALLHAPCSTWIRRCQSQQPCTGGMHHKHAWEGKGAHSNMWICCTHGSLYFEYPAGVTPSGNQALTALSTWMVHLAPNEADLCSMHTP